MRPGRIFEYDTRARPINPGPGFRFIEVGELRRKGDHYFNHAGAWRPALGAFVVVSHAAKNLYRRRTRRVSSGTPPAI